VKTATLDMPIRELFEDRPLLDRAVRSIALDQDIGYVDALDALQRGSESAHDQRTPTVRAAVEWAHSDPGEIEQGMRLLERRDGAVERTYKQALGKTARLKTNAQGLVRLDQGDERTADIGAALHDPAEQERRLARARTASGRFQLNEGRAEFLRQDKLYLEAGLDLVRTMERDAKHQTRQAKAQTESHKVARQLDQAISEAADKRQALKQLDAEIRQLTGGKCKDVKRDANAADRELKQLAQSAGKQPKKAKAKKQKTLAAPPGVDPRAHAMDRRVRDRMRTLERPEREYVVTLEEIMAEDRA
jgi:hypothetical protein